jgi:hypothetical protein
MPGGKKYTPPVSKAQARLFGAAVAGQIPGFSPDDAKNKLKGVNERKLPARKSKGGKK